MWKVKENHHRLSGLEPKDNTSTVPSFKLGQCYNQIYSGAKPHWTVDQRQEGC